MREQLFKSALGRNKNPAVKAIAELNRIVEPPETQEQRTLKIHHAFIAQAQTFANEGNSHRAAELLSKVGLELDVLSRDKTEKLVIGEDIVITVLGLNGNQIRVGIDAPDDVPVHREEIHQRIVRERKQWWSS